MYAYPAVRDSIDRFIGADELKAIDFMSRIRTRKATEVMGADELTASGPSIRKRTRKATEIIVADELLELESSSRKKKREANEARSLRAAKRSRDPCCYFMARAKRLSEKVIWLSCFLAPGTAEGPPPQANG
jgi:hypothetical protein